MSQRCRRRGSSSSGCVLLSTTLIMRPCDVLLSPSSLPPSLPPSLSGLADCSLVQRQVRGRSPAARAPRCHVRVWCWWACRGVRGGEGETRLHTTPITPPPRKQRARARRTPKTPLGSPGRGGKHRSVPGERASSRCSALSCSPLRTPFTCWRASCPSWCCCRARLRHPPSSRASLPPRVTRRGLRCSGSSGRHVPLSSPGPPCHCAWSAAPLAPNACCERVVRGICLAKPACRR